MRISHLAFDCSDATKLARFWAEVMGWDVSPESTVEWAVVGGPSRPPEAPFEYDTRWTTFADREGNEFCLVQTA